MRRYALSGFIVDSEVDLPRLPSADGSPDCVVRLDADLSARTFPRDSETVRRSDEALWFERSIEGATIHLRFPGVGRFTLSEDGARIVCAPIVGLAKEILRRLLISQLLPWAWSLQGYAVLHAGAVVLPEGAVAFVAPSGHGKSTLTGAFGREDAPILTDDTLLVDAPRQGHEDLRAYPGYPSVRLLADSLSSLFPERKAGRDDAVRTGPDHKDDIHLDDSSVPFAHESAPLRAVYFLERGATDAPIQITPLSARESYLALVQSAFHLDLNDADEYKRHFDRFARIARRLPARRVDYPSDLERLGELTRALREDVRRLVR